MPYTVFVVGPSCLASRCSTSSAARTDLPRRTDLGKLPPYRSHKLVLYGEQRGCCAGCGKHFEDIHLEVDHVVPKSKGGTDHKSNLQLLCGYCNKRKAQGSMSALMVKLLAERNGR